MVACVRTAFPSLMPEGVEHFIGGHVQGSTSQAFPSLMPEGVEHVTGALLTVLFSERFLR